MGAAGHSCRAPETVRRVQTAGRAERCDGCHGCSSPSGSWPTPIGLLREGQCVHVADARRVPVLAIGPSNYVLYGFCPTVPGLFDCRASRPGR